MARLYIQSQQRCASMARSCCNIQPVEAPFKLQIMVSDSPCISRTAIHSSILSHAKALSSNQEVKTGQVNRAYEQFAAVSDI